MDRNIVTGMVEDYCRTYILAEQTNTSAAVEVMHRFELLMAETAVKLDPVEAAAFLLTVEAERKRVFAEYRANPAALKQRLGVPLGIDAPRSRPSRQLAGERTQRKLG